MIGYAEGPWMVGPVDDCTVTHLGKDGVRYVVAEIDGDYNQPNTWPIMEANARLIAAAPEMYEALTHMRMCRSCGEGDWNDCEGGRAALAALSKAGGENG